jgi:hypothetical protein
VARVPGPVLGSNSWLGAANLDVHSLRFSREPSAMPSARWI